MSAPGGNRLPALAAEIAEAHARCRANALEAVRAAVDAGRRLIEAKELVGHGAWVPWLAANVPGVSVRTAQRYMRAARNTGENDSVSLLSLRELVRPASRPGRKGHREAPPGGEPGIRFGAGMIAGVPPAGCPHPYGSLAWEHLPGESRAVCGKCGKAVRLDYASPGFASVILFTQAELIEPGFRKRMSSGESEVELRAAATALICDRTDGVFHYVPGSGKPQAWQLPPNAAVIWKSRPGQGAGRRRRRAIWEEENNEPEPEDRAPSLWRSWLWSEFAAAPPASSR